MKFMPTLAPVQGFFGGCTGELHAVPFEKPLGNPGAGAGSIGVEKLVEARHGNEVLKGMASRHVPGRYISPC